MPSETLATTRLSFREIANMVDKAGPNRQPYVPIAAAARRKALAAVAPLLERLVRAYRDAAPGTYDTALVAEARDVIEAARKESDG